MTKSAFSMAILLLACSALDTAAGTEATLESGENPSAVDSLSDAQREPPPFGRADMPRYMSTCRPGSEQDIEGVVSQLVDGYALVSFAGAESLGRDELRIAVPNGSLTIPATAYRIVSSEGVSDSEGRRPEVVWVADPSAARFFGDDGSEAFAIGPTMSRPEGFALAHLDGEHRWVTGGFVGSLEAASPSALFPDGFNIGALSGLVAERRREAQLH